MNQALYRKWRPHLWKEVVGQEHVVRTLQNAIRTGRVGHAYLFSGPRGTGKTTTARLLAKAVNCLDVDISKRPCDRCEHCVAVNEGKFLDLIEIDAASNTSVDDVRELRETINFSPTQGEFKIYIIDEVHMLSTAAFNALLKTLEEPPAHAIFILATTEIHKIPATVLSRCQRHEFRRLSVNEIVTQLKILTQAEKIAIEDDTLVLIARQSTGSMRDAISLLDQLASTGEEITLATAQTVLGTATSQAVIALVQAILERQPASALDCIHQALDSGTDARQFARQVVDYLRGLLLARMDSADQIDATNEVRQQMIAHARQFRFEELLECVRLFNIAASEVRGGWQPGLLLELAAAESIHPKTQPAVPPAEAVLPRVQPNPAAPTATTSQPLLQRNPLPAEPAAVPSSVDKPAPQAAMPPPSAASLKSQATPEREKTAPLPAASVQAEPKMVEHTPAELAAPIQKVEMTTIQQNWNRIKVAAKELQVQLSGLLNSCSLVAIKDGCLVIGFSTQLLREKMEANDNLQLTRQAIQKVTGLDVPVVCVVLGVKTGAAGSDPEVEGDGIVGTALNLGGQIVQKGKTE